jgi:superoxide dismutase, Fe-Mn family
MLKKDTGAPQGALATAINQKFGSFDAFKQEWTKTAVSVFGSGWTWLVLDGSKQLSIETTPNQDATISVGLQPLLGIDVWEHAYYLKYQNRRPEYVAAFFNVINWDFVSGRYEKFVQ